MFTLRTTISSPVELIIKYKKEVNWGKLKISVRLYVSAKV